MKEDPQFELQLPPHPTRGSTPLPRRVERSERSSFVQLQRKRRIRIRRIENAPQSRRVVEEELSIDNDPGTSRSLPRLPSRRLSTSADAQPRTHSSSHHLPIPLPSTKARNESLLHSTSTRTKASVDARQVEPSPLPPLEPSSTPSPGPSQHPQLDHKLRGEVRVESWISSKGWIWDRWEKRGQKDRGRMMRRWTSTTRQQDINRRWRWIIIKTNSKSTNLNLNNLPSPLLPQATFVAVKGKVEPQLQHQHHLPEPLDPTRSLLLGLPPRNPPPTLTPNPLPRRLSNSEEATILASTLAAGEDLVASTLSQKPG